MPITPDADNGGGTGGFLPDTERTGGLSADEEGELDTWRDFERKMRGGGVDAEESRARGVPSPCRGAVASGRSNGLEVPVP